MTETSRGAEPMRAEAPRVETPSGKGDRDENFPVGSFLIPKRLRPHVATFYAFARAIDDIADNGDLSANDKICRLRAFDSILKGEGPSGSGYEKAVALRASMKATGVPTAHGSDLIAAFVQDSVKLRYKTWDELLGYCALSANPVGRYLLDLHGEERAQYKYADALSTVLQIVNHLQDCGDDRRALDRVYVVGDWMAEVGASVDDLDRPAMTQELRRVVDRMLDGCDTLMDDARLLPSALKSRRLAMESAVILNLAARLIALLRAFDPLAQRVALTKTDFARAGVTGAFGGFFAAGSLARRRMR